MKIDGFRQRCSLKLVLMETRCLCRQKMSCFIHNSETKKKLFQHLKSKTLKQTPLFNHLSTIHSTKLNFTSPPKNLTPKPHPELTVASFFRPITSAQEKQMALEITAPIKFKELKMPESQASIDSLHGENFLIETFGGRMFG